MKQTLLSILLICFVVGCTSEEQTKKANINTKEVDLYKRFSPSLGVSQFFEKESSKPYNGSLKTKTNWDQTQLTLKNGFFDGEYLTRNLQGDTIEVINYSKGKELSRIEYTYENDSLTNVKKIERVNGDNHDHEIFRRSLDLILRKEFDQLNGYLTHTFDDYQRIFERLTILFGPFEGYSIKKVSKECVSYEKSEYLKAELILHFKNKKLRSTWEIIEVRDELIGQDFTFGYFQKELLPNNLAVRFVRAFNNDDGSQLLYMLENGDSIWNLLKEDLKRIKKISEPKFLYCFLRSDVELVKVYSIDMDGSRMHLCLDYNINNIQNNRISDFAIIPFQRQYRIMERLN